MTTSTPLTLARRPERPAFSLIDHHSASVTEASYTGTWPLVFFGFTHCASVCPRELSKLSETIAILGDDASQLTPLYITVDPARDTPARMRSFLAEYPDFTGLTGAPGEIERAHAAFRVFARRTADPAAAGGYVVPHTALTYLLAPDGGYAAHFPETLDAAEVAMRIRTIVQSWSATDAAASAHGGSTARLLEPGPAVEPHCC